MEEIPIDTFSSLSGREASRASGPLSAISPAIRRAIRRAIRHAIRRG